MVTVDPMIPTAVVTGATGGIGAAVARALMERGYRVYALGRSAQKLAALYDTTSLAVPVLLDLAQYSELPPALANLRDVHALVHCAGVAEVASVEDTTPALWQETLAVNLVAPALLTRELLPALRAARGQVIFVNMAPGMHAVERWSAYVGSKAALREVADSLRKEEEPNGVRVTSVYPTGTATDLLKKVRQQFGHEYNPDRCVQPDTLASLIVATMSAPEDAHVVEVSVRPAPRPDEPSRR